VECDARQQAETLAKRLPAVETRNLFRSACGDRSSEGFLESVLEGKKAAISISALDTRDQKLFGFRTEISYIEALADSARLRYAAKFHEVDFTFI
jgi:hypothetical protein